MRLQAFLSLRRASLHSGRHARFSATRLVSTLGIRREDPSRIWERRVPLTPKAVQSLISEGVRVLIQPCARRVFPTEEYVKVGAEVTDSLQEAQIIIGIKETPLDELLTDPVNGLSRIQIMFSHTAKGQSYNMPLLSRFAQSSARLIDYELLTNENGKRVVAFGWYAGAAGVPEAFSALAHDHLKLGVSSPFLLLPRPYHHRGLNDLRQSLRNIGDIISQHGSPRETGPYIVALTGNGNVSQGALSLLEELPIKQVRVNDLEKLAISPDTPRNFIYLLHVQPEDYLIDIRGRPYSRATYYSQPEFFNSLFYQRIAPYISLLINGTGWKPGFPRLMNNLQLAAAQMAAQRIGRARFRTVADISCDIEGGLEFVSRAATIDDPFFIARPAQHPPQLPGIQVMSVDILPSEIPLDSSRHFSDKLMPYLRSLVRVEVGRNLSRDDASHLEVLRRGTIIEGGKLRGPHAWLSSHLTGPSSTQTIANSNSQDVAGLNTAEHGKRKHRVLILGSGMVAKPAVDHIASRKDIELIVASVDLREGAALVAPHDNASAVKLDALDAEALESLVKPADLVISLLPATLHATVAKYCIKYGRHLVTASYISPEMKALHEQATKADVLLLNEIGLDPGIDHCSAIDLCQRIREQGREIVSFTSVCGGLPAPEDSNVPLAYKFSWSPRGVLTAALNGAKFRLGNQDFTVQSGKLLDTVFPDIPLVPGLALDCLPNRDSISYGATYDLDPSKLETMFRGTLRYKGFASLMRGFISAGLLDMTTPINLNISGGWQSLLARTLSVVHNANVKNNKASLESALSQLLDGDVTDVLDAAEWLSIIPNFSPLNSLHTNSDLPSTAWSLPTVPPMPTLAIDLFARLLAHKLRYLPGESDSVILSHEIISRSTPASQSSSGTRDELIHTSTLILRQPHPTTSAMAVTVALPVALAALRILDGRVKTRGVVGPTADKEIYRPILQEMSTHGLIMKEGTKRWQPGLGLAGSMLDAKLVTHHTQPMNRRLHA